MIDMASTVTENSTWSPRETVDISNGYLAHTLLQPRPEMDLLNKNGDSAAKQKSSTPRAT